MAKSTRVRVRADAPSRRQLASEQRRRAILEAGLQVFAAHGFEASRLDEVAAKASVAKGTIYLFFKDKEDLFEQIVLNAVTPVLTQLDAHASRQDLPIDVLLSGLFEVFRREVLTTYRKEVIRLVISEGGRFPQIATFYHREVVAKGIEIVRRAAQRAIARGELVSNEIEQFPQLVFAPLLMSIVWDGLFSKIQPLDVEGLLAAHRRLLLPPGPSPDKHRRKST